MSVDQLWLYLLSHATIDLHLTVSEFWDLTFREYDAVSKRWKIRERNLDYRAGVIASAAIAGMGNTKADNTPFTPEDFFPSLKPDPKSAITPVQSVQDQIEAMEMWTALMRIQDKINRGELKVGD